MIYLVYGFGAFLVVMLVVIIIHYFSPKRKSRVEQPKYDILNDDDNDR